MVEKNGSSGNFAYAVAGCVFFAAVVVGGMTLAKFGITESHDIGNKVVAVLFGCNNHQNPLDEITAPSNLQKAVDAGHQVIGGDEKKSFVRIEGRVFAYDKSTGNLVN